MNNISIYKKIGNRIRECRDSMHVTQDQLAEASGFSTSYISRIERADSCPPLETICLIADALNVEISILLCDLLTETTENPVIQEIAIRASSLSPDGQQHLLEYMKLLSFYDKKQLDKKA